MLNAASPEKISIGVRFNALALHGLLARCLVTDGTMRLVRKAAPGIKAQLFRIRRHSGHLWRTDGTMEFIPTKTVVTNPIKDIQKILITLASL